MKDRVEESNSSLPGPPSLSAPQSMVLTHALLCWASTPFPCAHSAEKSATSQQSLTCRLPSLT